MSRPGFESARRLSLIGVDKRNALYEESSRFRHWMFLDTTQGAPTPRRFSRASPRSRGCCEGRWTWASFRSYRPRAPLRTLRDHTKAKPNSSEPMAKGERRLRIGPARSGT